MASTFITKRAHRKSRGGCQTCKNKKVKCDEAHPQCTYCSTRHLACVYTPFRSKGEDSRALLPVIRKLEDQDADFNVVDIPSYLAPAVVTSSGTMLSKDLPLMHFYSVFTWASLSTRHDGPTDKVMGLIVPQLAFENDFLLNAILGIASAHQQHMSPGAGCQRDTDDYRVKTLRGFRNALLHMSPTNYEAIVATSLLLLVLSSRSNIEGDDELCVVNWMTLYAGVNVVVDLRRSAGMRTDQMKVMPLLCRTFDKAAEAPTVPPVLLEMLDVVKVNDPDFVYIEDYYSALGCLGLLYTSLRKDGVGPDHSQRVVSWPTLLPDDFTTLARNHAPRALVILAHYLLFIKLLHEAWWMDGIPDREIKVIAGMVGDKWHSTLEIPLRGTQLSDPADVIRLILDPSSVPAPDISEIVADMETWQLEDLLPDFNGQHCSGA